MLRILCILFFSLALLQNLNAQLFGTLKDSRDGTIYKTVKIGSFTWMTKNLNTQKFNNGDIIPEAKTIKEWKDFVTNKQAAWCYLQFNPSIGLKYGKIYNWYAITDSRGLSPVGWHIPTLQEITELIRFGPPALKSAIGWEYNVIGQVKDSRGTYIGTRNEDSNGDNRTGFSALPGGYFGKDDFSTDCNALCTGWWSSHKIDPYEMYFCCMEKWSDKLKINLFQNDEQVSEGVIEGKLSIVDKFGKISYYEEGKKIYILPEYGPRLKNVKDYAFTDMNGNFKFENIPTGSFIFEVNYGGGEAPYYDRKSTAMRPINYDNIKGLQKDSNISVLFDYGIYPEEIEKGFYVRSVKNEAIIQPEKK
jgi:uncharacterized protein (TIGR02145 family)